MSAWKRCLSGKWGDSRSFVRVVHTLEEGEEGTRGRFRRPAGLFRCGPGVLQRGRRRSRPGLGRRRGGPSGRLFAWFWPVRLHWRVGAGSRRHSVGGGEDGRGTGASQAAMMAIPSAHWRGLPYASGS